MVLEYGSYIHFITNSFARDYGLKLKDTSSSISGVDSMSSSANVMYEVTILCHFRPYKYNIQLLACQLF